MSAIVYNGSFGGTSFMELYDGQLAVEPDSGVEYTTVHIPGGDTIVVQTSGRAPRTLDLPIAVKATELTALHTKANNATRASLVYHAGTTSARLMKVKDVRSAPLVDAYRAVLELVIG
jgi:hypothetical protein